MVERNDPSEGDLVDFWLNLRIEGDGSLDEKTFWWWCDEGEDEADDDDDDDDGGEGQGIWLALLGRFLVVYILAGKIDFVRA